MAMEFIAALAVAAALGGIAHLIRRLSGGALPKWVVSVAAGFGLLGFALWSEYAWYGRNAASLPEGVVVAATEAQPNPMRPWTYAYPFVSRFVAVDTRALAAHPTAPDLKMAKVYLFARWLAVRDGIMVFDCKGQRRVMVTEGMEIDASGQLTGAEWIAAGPDDGYQAAVCAGA